MQLTTDSAGPMENVCCLLWSRTGSLFYIVCILQALRVASPTEHFRGACHAQIRGTSEAVYTTYRSENEANAAYTYAQEQGWVGSTGRYGITFVWHQGIAALLPIDFLGVLEAAFNTALNAGQDRPRWYVVYKGLCPGIYRMQWVLPLAIAWC